METSARNRLAEFTASRLQIFYPKTDLPVADAVLQNLRNQSDTALGLTAKILHDVAAVAFPGANPKISRLEKQGTFHRLFLAQLPDGKQYVIRFNVAGLEWGGCTLHLEEWATRIARAAQIPAPVALLTDTSRRICPFDFQIASWISGRTLQDFDDDELQMQPLLNQFGTLLARLHKIPARGFGWFDVRPLVEKKSEEPAGLFSKWQDYLLLQLEAHVESCAQIGAVTRELARRVLDHFSNLAPQIPAFQPALLHGDPGNHNIATDGQKITALLDWEDCLAGDPIYELAFWATFHPERRHAGMIDAYRAIQPLPDDFNVRFWLYFLRVALAKTVHRHRFGYADKPGRPPAAQRIQAAVSRLEAALA